MMTVFPCRPLLASVHPHICQLQRVFKGRPVVPYIPLPWQQRRTKAAKEHGSLGLFRLCGLILTRVQTGVFNVEVWIWPLPFGSSVHPLALVEMEHAGRSSAGITGDGAEAVWTQPREVQREAGMRECSPCRLRGEADELTRLTSACADRAVGLCDIMRRFPSSQAAP